jgi:6-phosphogluconolactonase
MRMKLNKTSQLLLVSSASLVVAGLMTACSTLTVDFVFVTSAKAAGTNNYGEVDVFEVNSESGQMRQIPTSPFPSGGRNPVAEAVSSDNTNLYVVNQDDNSIVQFIIGNDGKLYPQNTVNTPGIFPLGVAVSGTNLFVVDLYQPLPTCSTAAPCSGSVGAFSITASSTNPPSDALGSPIANGDLDYLPLCLTGYTHSSSTSTWNCTGTESHVIVPTAVTALKSGGFVYVSAYDSSVTPNVGYVFGFANSGGNLSPANAGGPTRAGVHPSGIAGDPTSTYLYVTDFVSGNVVGFTISSGQLSGLAGSPFPAGDQPSSIVVDPSYPFAYVANEEDSSVTAYSTSNGALTQVGTYSSGLQPVAIGIDPSTNHFLYTANYLGAGASGSVSGWELSSSAGTLLVSKNSPYTSNAFPTAVAAIPHNSPTSSSSK